MDIIQKLQENEKAIKKLQSEKDKQSGMLAQLYAQLKTEFGVDTLEDAVKLLETLQTGVIENETKLQKLDTEMGSIILTAENK